MSERLIVLDKQTRVFLVGVGKLGEVFFLSVCLSSRLPKPPKCVSMNSFVLEFKISGMLTRPQKIGVFYLSTKNVFNKINRIVMLWTVRHLWPSRSLFFCYRRWSYLILRNMNGAASFLHSREGVM